MLVASAIRHRLRGKQVAPYPCPAASPPIHFSDIARSVQSGAAQAIEAENCAADGLLVLPWDIASMMRPTFTDMVRMTMTTAAERASPEELSESQSYGTC